MDLRVIDGTIQPLRSRIVPDEPGDMGALSDIAPMDDDGALLAFSGDEEKQIGELLDAEGIAYHIVPEDQPDPAVLAACQGKVSSRTEALAALAAGRAPATLSDIATRVGQLEAASVEPGTL